MASEPAPTPAAAAAATTATTTTTAPVSLRPSYGRVRRVCRDAVCRRWWWWCDVMACAYVYDGGDCASCVVRVVGSGDCEARWWWHRSTPPSRGCWLARPVREHRRPWWPWRTRSWRSWRLPRTRWRLRRWLWPWLRWWQRWRWRRRCCSVRWRRLVEQVRWLDALDHLCCRRRGCRLGLGLQAQAHLPQGVPAALPRQVHRHPQADGASAWCLCRQPAGVARDAARSRRHADLGPRDHARQVRQGLEAHACC